MKRPFKCLHCFDIDVGPAGPGPLRGPRPPMMDGAPMAGPNQPLANPQMIQTSNPMMANQPPQGMVMGPGSNPMMPTQGFPIMQSTSMTPVQTYSTATMTQIGAAPITSTFCYRCFKFYVHAHIQQNFY